ncbi:MAG: type II secretion system F family protein [Janthinobacterium lividum]
MLLLLTTVITFSLFLPFIVLAGRRSDEYHRMRARFALLQTGGAGGLSPGRPVNLLKDVGDQSTGRIESGITKLSAALNLETTLLQAGSGQTPRTLLRTCLLTAIATSVCTLAGTHSWFFATLIGAGASFLPLLLLRFRANRRTAAMNKVLPNVLDLISRALRAGHSMPAAIGMVAEGSAEPARTAFSEVFQKQKFGLPLRDALLELVRCFPSEDLKVFVTAILVQRDTGGNLVQILERTSAVIRERLKLQGDVRVHTAQGRLTGWILCLLPVLMLGLLTLSNPSYPKVLVDDPLGRKLLYTGVVLLLAGGYMIHRIVKGIEV